MTTRRELLIGGSALAASAAVGRVGAATTGFSDKDYQRAIVIDGLGGLDDPYSPDDATVLDPRAVADLRTSGLTMSHYTISAVGNGADTWEQTIVAIAKTDRFIADNPETVIKVSTTDDIRRAKREGKMLGRKRIIVDREKIRAMHAAGGSVRQIAAKTGVSKSLVANVLKEQVRGTQP